ncbi:MAG: DUF1987 domain-containing protein [Bacteroidales bacterium]|nr:DUF1987 domain-containing protein [Bacteroidales bacterium]
MSYKPDGYLPGIILDRDSGKFEISGKTCPEDAIEFYDPVFNWLDEYSQNPLEETVFDFRLTYFNTVSSKILMMIMLRLEEISEKGNNVKVRWFYPEDDEDLEEAGQDFENMLDVNFELIPYEDDDNDDDNVGITDSLIDSLL